jgi:tRNA A-37 threonylcarbamoyl transferase component Bud32
VAEPKKLGRYELRQVLGKGAMGVVYEGYDPTLGRQVAIKTILQNAAIDPDTERAYAARFAVEAKAVARLNHPNIIQVHDFGVEGDVAYIVMEFIRGRELRSYFDASERFTEAESVRIMCELLEALQFAHDAGVIHRDVKPANVMLDAQRRVKLADFGVARIQDSDKSAAGTMVGTPAFMSPEQITGGKIDRRTDLFSAGVVLYQLLTGEQPFKGDGAWTVARQIMQDEPPPPSRFEARFAPAFDAIVDRALAKNPSERFADANEFAAALRAALAPGAQPLPAPRPRPKPALRDPDATIALPPAPVTRGRALWAIAAAAVVAAGVAAFVFLERDQQPRKIEVPAAEIEKIRKETEERIRRELADKSAAEQAAAAKAATEKAMQEKLAALEKAAAEKAAAEKAAAEKAAAEKTMAETALAEKLAAAKSAAERAAIEKAAAEKAAAARLAEEKAAAEKSAATKLAEEKAAAERIAAEKAAAAKAAPRPAPAGSGALPAVGDRWVYEARETTRPERSYEVGVTVQSVSAASVRDTTTVTGGSPISATHTPGAHLQGIFSGIASFSPYLAAFHQLRSGETWTSVDQHRFFECATFLSCTPVARIDGREKVTVKAGTFDAWKVVVDVSMIGTLRGQGDFTFWYAPEVKRFVKYRSRVRYSAQTMNWMQPNIDMELVSYTPAGGGAAEKAPEKAPEKAAEKNAVAALALVGKPGWPQAGDRWGYEVREMNGMRNRYPLAVSVQSTAGSQVRESYRSEPGGEVQLAQQGGAAVTGVAPGVASFMPYLRAFREIKAGEQLPGADAGQLWECATTFTCTASARVAGAEKVTVRGGSFDAWKIVVELQFAASISRGVGEITFWYSEQARRIVRYQSRFRYSGRSGDANWSQPDVDMELVSYTPAGAR